MLEDEEDEDAALSVEELGLAATELLDEEEEDADAGEDEEPAEL